MINKILVYECVSRRNKTIHVLDPGDFFCEHNNRIFSVVCHFTLSELTEILRI